MRATAALSVLLLHVLYQPAVEANIARGLWRFGYQLEVAVPLFFAPLFSLKSMPEPVGNDEKPDADIVGEALDETARLGISDPNVLTTERAVEANRLSSERFDEPPATT